MSRNIIRKPAVRKKTGLSDTTIWRLEKIDDFPARVQITEGGAVGWYEDEVDRWVHDRVRGAGKRPPLADRGKAAWSSMRQKQHDPLRGGGGSRSGIDDFAGSDTSGQCLPSTDSLKQAAARQLRRQRAIDCVHKLGARATFEFVDELVRYHPEITADLDRRLAVYAERLSPALLATTGGDRFATASMHAIGGCR